MHVLVAHESRYGSTRAIAERIATTLRDRGFTVDERRAGEVRDASVYDAFVVGSAVYYGAWLKDATAFVQTNIAFLASRPVWLFSSGPISAGTTDAQGRDLRALAEPKAVADLVATIAPRDHRVFWGALDRGRLGFADRIVASMPTFPGSEGDFRDWDDIERWATAIATELAARVPVPAGA